jgi:hypothetical protein
VTSSRISDWDAIGHSSYGVLGTIRNGGNFAIEIIVGGIRSSGRESDAAAFLQ